MKDIIVKESKTKEKFSHEEMSKYFDGKTSQAITAKHRALAAKMSETGEVDVDVNSLRTESGLFILTFIVCLHIY